MNTPLKTAVQAVIAEWEEHGFATDGQMKYLCKALEAEQAQAASCGYDETVGLCTSNPCCYQAAPVQKEQAVEPKCVARIEVFGKDWKLDYLSLPVGVHELYAQTYTYTHPTPPPASGDEGFKPDWATYRQGVEDGKAETQQVAVPAWTLTADKMPEPCMNVMAYTGKGQPIRAQWVPAKTLEDNGDGDFGEYDEATDMYYWPEAWYETNAHEETHWMVDGHVTHWMPLPLPPQGAKP